MQPGSYALVGLCCTLAIGCQPTVKKACEPGVILDKPQLCASRARVDFVQGFTVGTSLGTEPLQTLELKNGGVADLTLHTTANLDPAFRLTGSWGAEVTAPVVVKGNQSVFLALTFKPTEAKASAGTVTLESDAENLSTLVIAVNGCGVPTDAGAPSCFCRVTGSPCSTSTAPCCSSHCGLNDAGSNECQP